jgi:putative FmdB family regulatory protein
MPIYEYRCQDCGEHTELVQKFSDAPVTECPHCHKQSLEKLISAAAFHLKGAGWYVTDFRDKTAKTSTPTDKKQDKPTEKTDNKVSNTKESKTDGGKVTPDSKSD